MQRIMRVAAVLTVLFASVALADQRTDTGFYLSAGGGQSRVDAELNLVEDSGPIPRFAAGWQITPFWGIEAAYHNFHEFHDRFATLADYDVRSLSLAGTARYPLSPRVAIFAKLGQLWWATDLNDTFCSRGPAGCTTTMLNLSETDTFAGMGAGFKLTDRFEMELEYDWFEFNFADDISYFSNETSLIAVSLKYSF